MFSTLQRGVTLMVLAAASVYADPCDSPSMDAVLSAIKICESRAARKVLPHPDGVSWANYGLTQMAVDELVRIGKLPAGTSVAHVVADPARERNVAAMFLEHCMEQARKLYGGKADWIDAASVYHAWISTSRERDRFLYRQRIRRALETQR